MENMENIMVKTVIGSFDSVDDANRAVRELRAAGFVERDINLIANNVQRGVATGAPVTNPGMAHDNAAATGAVAGGALGGAAGLAASLMGLAIPGIGPILAAGPIVAALAGAGAGAVAGGLIGGLTNSGSRRMTRRFTPSPSAAAGPWSPYAPTSPAPTKPRKSCAMRGPWTSTAALRNGVPRDGPGTTPAPNPSRSRRLNAIARDTAAGRINPVARDIRNAVAIARWGSLRRAISRTH
jgi:hypothetical protein